MAQPFSAPRPRSLPTVTPAQSLNETLANWKTQLAPLVKNVAPQATPHNFGVTNSRGGLTLNWSPVSGADGYEILRSLNGSFTDDLQVIPIKNANQSSYFDGLGGNSTTAHYRIRTTSGTAANPQSQRGPESGPVRHTSIDSSDTKSVPVTVFDRVTTDATRANARFGNYGAINPTPSTAAGGGAKGISAAIANANSAAVGQRANAIETAGATRAYYTVDENYQIATTFNQKPLNTQNYVSTGGAVAQSGTSTLLTVGSGTFQFGAGAVDYNSGSVDPGSYGTWYIYADDPTYSGGAAVYQASSSPPTVFSSDGRLYWGKITTTSGGGGSGGGGGSHGFIL